MAATQPRAQGVAAVGVAVSRGRSRLVRLRQQGSAKCLLPGRPAHPDAVFLNTAGGITGGDRLCFTAEAGAGARLRVATQTAERAYRAVPGQVGRVETHLVLGAGARLDWLPQETILFEGCAVERWIEVEMAADATLLMAEAGILGRAAMGERVTRGHYAEQWRVRRAGALVFADALRLSGPVAEIAARPALFGPNKAWASILYAAPDAEDRLSEARELLGRMPEAVEAGASAWNGLLALRMLAPGGKPLRAALMTVLAGLGRAALPRVWTM
ncbi:MAG: urease accessory protein UreD [Pikeienuella sp.]